MSRKLLLFLPLPGSTTAYDNNDETELLTDKLFARSLPIPKLTLGVNPRPIRTQARAATILPNFVGLKFQVYNGKVYHEVQITEEMVGHKLGEFSP